jgi:hypothetical protein
MRKALANQNERRARFRGTFVRYGKKPAFRGPDLTTILLKDITDVGSGSVVCDHLWFNQTKGFASLGPLQEGDVLEFDARVKSYVKGYFGHREDVCKLPELDYRLSHPTKVIRVMATERREG